MKIVLTILFKLVLVPLSFCCTTFFINRNGVLLFGRNYDWVTGNGMLFTNQRGLFKISVPTGDGKTISWTSKYGSLTFNQYGKEFPTGGMNEKGLVVELMWLDETKYPQPDHRPAIGVLQWIQYQLDNCETIEEVIDSDKKLRIASIGTTPLHYLVADAKGNAATIEFLDGKMVFHKGSNLPFPVLTNDSYAGMIEMGLYKKDPAVIRDYSNSSPARFAKVCHKLEKLPSGSLVDYSFSILEEVAQNNTKWSIVYDIKNRKVYFKTTKSQERKAVSLTGFNFDCRQTSKYCDMDQKINGSIEHVFAPFDQEKNMELINRSCDETSSQFIISPETRRKTWEYANLVGCEKAGQGISQ